MKTAVIYARYSSDMQSATSIEDQVRLCRQRLNQLDLVEVACYYDEATSGSIPVHLRTGGSLLLNAVEQHKFDILCIEGLDRLSRNLFEQEKVIRQMELMGIRIIGVSDGYDSNMSSNKLLRSVRGAVNELFIDDLRLKTHRGLTGQVLRGFIAAGKSYGYDIQKVEGGSIYIINPEQADWVKYIFREYAEGASVRKIVHAMNQLGIPSPRNTSWAVSAIYGSPLKGSGILNNHIYIGQLIWNRSKWITDGQTGKRYRLERPKTEWIITDIPELRIIEQDIWDQVRKRIDSGRGIDGKKKIIMRNRTLLGGLLKCPHCKGPLIAVNNTKYGCLNEKDRGKTVCQGFYIDRHLIESRVVDTIRTEFLSAEAASRFEKYFKEAIDRLQHQDKYSVLNIKMKLEEIEQQIDKLVNALATLSNTGSESIVEKLKKLEEDKQALIKQQKLKANAQMPDVSAIYNEVLDNLLDKIKSRTDKVRPAIEDYLGAIPLTIENNSIYAYIRTSASKLLLKQEYLTVVAGARKHLHIFEMVDAITEPKKIWITNYIEKK